MGHAGGPPESAARSIDAGALIELGRIVNRHGVGGEVRMLPHNPDSIIVSGVPSVVLCGPDGSREQRRIVAARRHKRFFLLRLEGVSTADHAEALIGRVVCVCRDQLPTPGPREVYHADLIGCTVRTDAGEHLGDVRDVLVTGSNDVCVVVGRGGEYLIPLVDDVIVQIDVTAAEIIVRPVPGLLER